MLNISIPTLYFFMEIAECHSYSQAADKLYISQSSLSKSIQRLESELNVKLFERKSHGVILTVAGQHLYSGLVKLRPDYERIIEETVGFSKRKTIICHFTMPASMFYLSEHLQAYGRTHANILLSSINAKSYTDAVNALFNKQADFIFSHMLDPAEYAYPFQNYLELEALCDDPMYAVVPTDHPLALKPTVRFSDLKEEPILVNSLHIEDNLRNLSLLTGVFPNIMHTYHSCTTRHAQLAAVKFGRGITVYCKNDLKSFELGGLKKIRIADIPKFQLILAYPKGTSLQDHHQKFRQYLIELMATQDLGE